MMTETITLRVDAAERAEIASRAQRDMVSLSDYIRVRLGLRAEGPQNSDSADMTATDDARIRAQLADHDRRLAALEADRAVIATA
jgi:hypothetical protein